MVSENRLLNLSLLLALFFSLITVTLLNLQVFRTDRYRTLSEENCFKKEIVVPVRGSIISSDNAVIATSKRYFSLYGEVSKINMDAGAIGKLSELIAIQPDSINALIKMSRIYDERDVLLKSNLDIATVTFLEENGGMYQGLSIRSHPRRFYPYEYVYSHVLGYVGNITQTEYEKYKQLGYSITDFIGKTGVERSYEKYLKGQNGIKYFETDVYGRVIREIEKKNAVEKINGNDVYVTLNHRMQMYIDTLMTENESGCILLLDAKDGSVISMYSKPSFDPNIFVYGIRRDMWDYLKRNPLSPFLNRCTDGVYPPGSTFKILTTLSGLNEGFIDSQTYFQECNGSIMISNRIFNCWSTHYELDLLEAFKQSCDVYYYQLGMKIGLDKLARYAYLSGFGDAVGIDIYEESNGLVPDTKYLNKKYGRNGWGIGQTANLSIGQGDLLVTPIQMASFLLAILNGGEKIIPHIVDSIIDKQNEVRFRHKKKINGKLVFSNEDMAFIRLCMTEAVNGDKGTGAGAKSSLCSISGKTGTAENSAGIPHAWFVSYFPSDNPEVVCVIVLENSGHGGEMAAPFAKRIAEKWMNMK